jgi:hypothetical protein
MGRYFVQRGIRDVRLWPRVDGWRGAAPVAAAVGALVCLASSVLAGAESRLRVDYDGSRLSVEAREVSLLAVLSEIGSRVGFTAVETAPSSRIVTFSIRDASLDDVLRQLLRGENHSVLYRAASDGSAGTGEKIDRIVLSGEPGPLTPGGVVGLRADSRNAGDGQRAAPAATRSVTALPPPRGETPSRMWWDLPVALPGGGDSSAPPVTVGGLLRSHAMPGVPSAPPRSLEAAPAAIAPPSGAEAGLAETTRRAQQALGALVDGLAKATRSLHESGAIGRR